VSTILDALRKAKQEPPRTAVDASPEILRPQTHDYLATVPGAAPVDQVRRMRAILIAMVCVVFVLVVAVVALVVLLPGKRSAAPETAERTQAPSASSTASAPVPAPVATQPPREVLVTLAMPTLTPPLPTVTPTNVPEPSATPKSTKSKKKSSVTETKSPKSTGTKRGTKKTLSQFHISGIIWDPNDPLALVNGEMLRVGSRLGGAKVVKITPRSVIFEMDGEQYTITQ
jgi:hypothetical protein